MAKMKFQHKSLRAMIIRIFTRRKSVSDIVVTITKMRGELEKEKELAQQEIVLSTKAKLDADTEAKAEIAILKKQLAEFEKEQDAVIDAENDSIAEVDKWLEQLPSRD